MNRFMRLFVVGSLCLTSWSLYAVDNPTDFMGSQKFDKMKCISEATQSCINQVCLTSEQRDCQQSCQTIAQQKCRQQENE
jgi:hypothetical protein